MADFLQAPARLADEVLFPAAMDSEPARDRPHLTGRAAARRLRSHRLGTGGHGGVPHGLRAVVRRSPTTRFPGGPGRVASRPRLLLASLRGSHGERSGP